MLHCFANCVARSPGGLTIVWLFRTLDRNAPGHDFLYESVGKQTTLSNSISSTTKCNHDEYLTFASLAADAAKSPLLASRVASASLAATARNPSAGHAANGDTPSAGVSTRRKTPGRPVMMSRSSYKRQKAKRNADLCGKISACSA